MMYWIIVLREEDEPVSSFFINNSGVWEPSKYPLSDQMMWNVTARRFRWRDLSIAFEYAESLCPNVPITSTVEVWECDEHGNMQNLRKALNGGRR